MQKLVIKVALHTTIDINKWNHNIYTYILSHSITSTSVILPLSHTILTRNRTSPCPVLIMHSAWLGSDKYQFESHRFDSTRVQTHGFVNQTRKVKIFRSLSMRGGHSGEGNPIIYHIYINYIEWGYIYIYNWGGGLQQQIEDNIQMVQTLFVMLR